MSDVVLVADCPWRFSDALPGDTRGASRQYPTLSVAELRSFPMPEHIRKADNAVCFFWRVASMQQEALDVLKAWDFTVKTELVWEKLTPTGKPHFGMGRYVRSSHEVCLIATRGRMAPTVRNVRSRFAAPVREHSQKPDEFYVIVEALYPFSFTTKHFEVFARTVRPGWIQLGNELGKLPLAAGGERA